MLEGTCLAATHAAISAIRGEPQYLHWTFWKTTETEGVQVTPAGNVGHLSFAVFDLVRIVFPYPDQRHVLVQEDFSHLSRGSENLA
jgi:hypothetical protein